MQARWSKPSLQSDLVNHYKGQIIDHHWSNIWEASGAQFDACGQPVGLLLREMEKQMTFRAWRRDWDTGRALHGHQLGNQAAQMKDWPWKMPSVDDGHCLCSLEGQTSMACCSPLVRTLKVELLNICNTTKNLTCSNQRCFLGSLSFWDILSLFPTYLLLFFSRGVDLSWLLSVTKGESKSCYFQSQLTGEKKKKLSLITL